ncbi:MAG: prolipoprotein diacylglyceryl transferase family protein [Acidimicrobiales bacterium]
MPLAYLDYDAIVRFSLGPLSISPHGVGTAVGFIAGARLMLPAARRRGTSDAHVYAMLTRAAVGAVIGARVAFVINHLGSYDNPVGVARHLERRHLAARRHRRGHRRRRAGHAA